MFNRKKAVSLPITVIDMLKEKPLEMYRTDDYCAMYAPGVDRVVITKANRNQSEGDCLKSLVLAMRGYTCS